MKGKSQRLLTSSPTRDCRNRRQEVQISRLRFASKPHVTQREAKKLAQEGISLRPGIERDTLLMPWVIAESVLHEASRFLGLELPDAWADFLDQRAEHCYAKHRQFRHLVRKERAGRSYLYAFFRHWLSGKLHKTNLSLYRRLPHSYLLGAVLPLRR
jgi:hypothetical protein